ncbi:MAG: dephospho-CoA kinase [Elusimicrobiales bacterium]
MAKTLIVGLTGSPASGKSEAAKVFRELGAEVVCADALAKLALEAGSAACAGIRRKFGKKAFRPDGSVNRQWLADRVFSAPALKKWLEMQVHPIVIIESLKTLRSTKRDIAVFDAPLLFEAQAQRICDITLCVRAKRELRLERAIRRGWSEAEFSARDKAQFPQERKAALADVVIDNSGSRKELAAKITELYRTLISIKI